MDIPGIPILNEFIVPAVNTADPASMLDGAPILFGQGGYFLNICNQTVEVSTVDAVDLLYQIEIAESITIDHDIILPVDRRDAVNGKTNNLVQ